MATEQPVTTVGNTDNNQTSTDSPSTDNSTITMAAPIGEAPVDNSAAVESRQEEDESRPASEDFGQLLDQFEQEQSSLQEGEVVRGTVVGITERGVVIDFGYKSEGIVNQSEFMENGEITVKRGDE